jgi:hypothetical protein
MSWVSGENHDGIVGSGGGEPRVCPVSEPCFALTLPGRPGCRLDLRSGPRSVAYHGSDARDGIRDMALAAVDLARGRTSTSFAWCEDFGGVFVDINLSHRNGTVVVHEMHEPDWTYYMWFPQRGPVLFRLTVTARRFITDFFTAIVGLPDQVAAADRPVWGHDLPSNLIGELRRYLDLGRQAELNDEESMT